MLKTPIHVLKIVRIGDSERHHQPFKYQHLKSGPIAKIAAHMK